MREALLFVAPSAALLAAIALAAGVTGTGSALAGTLRGALPDDASLAARALGVVLVADLARERSRPPRLLLGALGSAAGLALLARGIYLASAASLPSEFSWSEGPFLINALKLDAGQPLYGAPANLDSYTYSPLVDLLHHALLAPFHLELSLRASRVIVLAEQLGAAAVLAGAAGAWRDRARLWVLPPLGLACMASSIAPAVHPDHGVLFCVAVAFLMLEDRPRRSPVGWLVLVLVTPVAVAFKLSGGGIGLGLAAAFALERRWREVAVLAVSGALCLATVPLFDATLGRFSEYAIGLQAASPIVWRAFFDVPLTPFGLAACAAGGALVIVRRFADALPRSAVRGAVLSVGVALGAVPGYIKYCGRDNNLTVVLVCAVFVLVRLALDHGTRPGPRLHPGLLPFAALVFPLYASPPAPPVDATLQTALRADLDASIERVREDEAAHRATLPLLDAVAWIEAGRREVPHDRLLSALEFWLARRPEAEILLSHLADGRYDTIIVSGQQLRDRTGLRGEYDARLLTALERGYVKVYPAGAVAPTAVTGTVIFVRR